jgi:hypothetical protein
MEGMLEIRLDSFIEHHGLWQDGKNQKLLLSLGVFLSIAEHLGILLSKVIYSGQTSRRYSLARFSNGKPRNRCLEYVDANEIRIKYYCPDKDS